MTLSGKNCLVTGASSGLGLAVSRRLAKGGANTIMLCRTREEGDTALRQVKAESPEAAVDLAVCDLASMQSIRRFVRELASKYPALDVLFNNAAVMKQKRTLTEDGFEMMFQVNYLAPFVLMNSLTDLLKKSASPRVINNGRPSDKLRLNFDDLQFANRYSMYQSFFQTKLCLLLSGLEYARRHESDGIALAQADPGPFKSNLVRDMPLAGWVKNLISASVESAAENILFVMTSESIAQRSGQVFVKKQEKSLVPYWNDRSVRERLWLVTANLIEQSA